MKKRAPESDVGAMAAPNARRQDATLKNSDAQLSTGSGLDVSLSLSIVDSDRNPFKGSLHNGMTLFASITITSGQPGNLYIAAVELVDTNKPGETPQQLLLNSTLYPSPSSLPNPLLTSPQDQIASPMPRSVPASWASAIYWK